MDIDIESVYKFVRTQYKLSDETKVLISRGSVSSAGLDNSDKAYKFSAVWFNDNVQTEVSFTVGSFKTTTRTFEPEPGQPKVSGSRFSSTPVETK